MDFFAEYYSQIISDIFLRNLFASALVLFVGGLIQGYTGFGGGTISVPVLVILFGPVVAIGIITPVYILGAATILPSAIKNVDWTEVLPVSIAGSIAVFLGLSFLITADPIVVKKIMGFFILFTTGIMILGKKYTGPRNILASAAAGIFTGGISGGTGIPGAPIMVMYYLAAKTAPAIQRANILTTGSVFSFCIIVGLGTNNIYSPTLILTVLMLSPVFMIAARLGQFLFNYMPAVWFKKVAHCLLVIAGTMLLVY